MTASMSRKRNCQDNVPTESFFSSLNNDREHGTTYATRADTQADLFGKLPPLHGGLRLADSAPRGLARQACRSAIQVGVRTLVGRRSSKSTSVAHRFAVRSPVPIAIRRFLQTTRKTSSAPAATTKPITTPTTNSSAAPCSQHSTPNVVLNAAHADAGRLMNQSDGLRTHSAEKSTGNNDSHSAISASFGARFISPPRRPRQRARGLGSASGDRHAKWP